jgi:hypothetical protein
MYLKSGLLYLAAAAGLNVVNADFMVYTAPPIPTSAIPSFANPSDVLSPFPPQAVILTLPGLVLDNIRFPQRQHRLPLLHKLARRALQIFLVVRRIRDRSLRVHRLKLLDTSTGDRVRDNDVLRRADVV